MSAFFRPFASVLLVLAASSWLLQARPPATLGDPPPAPTPEEVARLPHGGVSKHGPTGPFTVNIASREGVRNFFTTVYAASVNYSLGWSGDLNSCNAGTTDAGFRDLVLLRINYFRAMAGIPAGIVLNDVFNGKDQQAALMMSANNALNHFPPSSWICYTSEGAEAAGKSNIALGFAGPDAIDGYLEDFGANNAVVGHRRWILYPQTQTMGTGDVDDSPSGSAANGVWVQDGNYGATRPPTRDGFVCWPPPGFVPYQLIYARWSFSYPDADFTSATVTMSTNGVNIPVTLEQVANGYGENTLVWYPSGLDLSGPVSWPRPDTDTVYDVVVANWKRSGLPISLLYKVTVFDPQTPGPDAVLPIISGPDQPAVNQTNPYSFASVTNATGYQWRLSQRAAFTAVEGAENGLTYFTTNTAASYNVIVTSPVASGAHAFHLSHTQPSDQSLTYTRALLPGANSQMQFNSRLGSASSDETAKVQASLDQGQTWQDVYSQVGTGSQGETSFSTRTVSLIAFADRTIQVRFSFNFSSGSYYTGATAGWFIDDISFSNTEELTNPVITAVPSGTNFNFVPAQAGDYALDVRAQVYGQYYLEWGPIKRVTAAVVLNPIVQFNGSPSVSGNQVQIDFDVTNYRANLVFQLLQASDVAGTWTVDTSALIQTNPVFRVTTSTGGASKMFYRLQVN